MENHGSIKFAVQSTSVPQELLSRPSFASITFLQNLPRRNTESFKQQAAVPCFTRVTRRNSFIPLQSTDHLNRFSNNPLSFTKCPPYFHLLCSWGSHGNCYKLVLSLHKLPVQLLQIQLFLHAYSNSESKSYLRNAGSIAFSLTEKKM